MASVKNNFDIFDQYLARRENQKSDVEIIEEEESSSSSYYEEEIIEAPLSRLSTVHELDVSDSNAEEISETEVFWEEVSESINCESEHADDGDATEELDTTSDMVERVRNMLRGESTGDKNNSWEEAENSSTCDSSSSEGSSSVPPMDFDLGSFEEGEPHSSDEEEEDPDYYEQACRIMIATIHPNSDPDTLLHGCDLHSLYTNLKQQYRHQLRNRDTSNAPKTDSIRNLLRKEAAIVNDDDVDEFAGLSLKQDSDKEMIRDDVELCDVNNIPTVEFAPRSVTPESYSNNYNEQNAITPTPKVEKWLERDADDPKDYVYACRLLCRSMYDAKDPDYDVDTMLRRATPVDLYRYLKHNFWYLVHTNQLDETVLHRNAANEVYAENGEEKELKNDEKKAFESTMIDIELPSRTSASYEVLEAINNKANLSMFEIRESSYLNSNGTEVLKEKEFDTDKKKIEESTQLETNFHSSNSSTDEVPEALNNKADHPTQENIEISCSKSTQTEILTGKEQDGGVKRISKSSSMDTKMLDLSLSADNGAESTNSDKIHSTKDDTQSSRPYSTSVQTTAERKREIEASPEVEIIEMHTERSSIKFVVEEKSENDNDCISRRHVQEIKLETDNMQDESDHLIVEDSHISAHQRFSIDEENSNVKKDSVQKEIIEISQNINAMSSCRINESSLLHETEVTERELSSSKDAHEELIRGDASNSSSEEKPCDIIEITDVSAQTDKFQNDLNCNALTRFEEDFSSPLERQDNTMDECFSDKEDAELNSITAPSSEATQNDGYMEENSQLNDAIPISNEEPNKISKTTKSGSVTGIEVRSPHITIDKNESKIIHSSIPNATKNVDSKEGCSLIDNDNDNAELKEERNIVSETYPSIHVQETTDVKLSSNIGVQAEHKILCGNDFSIERNDSSFSLNHLQNNGIEKHIIHSNQARPKNTFIDPREHEWRKKKIKEDLMSIIKETEDLELLQTISPEIVAALNVGSLKTALTKKYYSPVGRDHIYYPSVAKAVQNFSLIEEAEKIYREEFSFDLSTALCTVAVSRIKQDDYEVNENDIDIKESSVTVVIDHEIEACSHKKAMRLKMIENELSLIIHDVKQQMGITSFEPIVLLALQKAAYGLCYLKEGFDNETEKHVYYPSVAKVICNLSLINEAKTHLAQGNKHLPPDLTETLRNIAAAYLMGNNKESEEKLNANNCKISVTDFNKDKNCPKLPAAVPPPSENEVRKKRIEIDLLSIIKHAELHYHGENVEDEAIDSLFKAANELVFIKKYYDVATDSFKYFPSLKATILNSSLTDKAENYYFNGVHKFPLDYKSVLRASAIELCEDFEVDERDDYVVNMAVDLDIDDSHEENQLEKYRDSGMTNDTVSMISSLIDGSSLNAEALFYVNEEGHSSIGRCATEHSINTFEDRNYRDDLRKIDQSILDLESQLLTELNRLDNEANACSLKHKIEAERIEKDRSGVEEQILAHENMMMEQNKLLLEKLNTTVAMLDLERKKTCVGVEVIETDKEEAKAGKNWSWIYKPKKINLEKEKQKQGKLMKFKLREIELQKDIDDIKAQLDFVKQQAKAKKRNIREWRTELDEEHRNLEELTTATEEKLKEEMKHLHVSYEEEKKRLLKKKYDLEKSKEEQGRNVAFKKEILQKISGSGELDLSRTKNEMRDQGLQCDHTLLEEENLIEGDAVGEIDQRAGGIPANIHAEGASSGESVNMEDKIPKKVMSGEDISSQSNGSNISGNDTLQDDSTFVTDLHVSTSTKDEINDKSVIETNYGEVDSIQSSATGIAEESLAVERCVGKDDSASLQKASDVSDDENSAKNGDVIVPDHLAFLNQPRDLEDELSLRSLEIFDLPEETELPSKNILTTVVTGKRKDNTEKKKTEEKIETIPDHSGSKDQPQRSQEEVHLKSPGVVELSKGNELLASAFERKRLKAVETISDKTDAQKQPIAEERISYVSHSPRLSKMRRKVEVALERAVAIRNGDSSSHHRETVPPEDGSIADTYHSNRESSTKSNRSLSGHSRSPTRRHVNPIYPMIRETDRLSGFIRRYEKKLEIVCKSLLTLASVTADEKEVLAARELELPKMLDFVVQQDWYKAHSIDKNSVTIPHFVFSKVKFKNDINSDGSNGYMVSAIGKSFLQIDGPVASDVCRFLTYLNRIEEGLTRDAMQAQWTEIARLSGDEQSRRVRDKLDNLISFCVEARMIKNKSEE